MPGGGTNMPGRGGATRGPARQRFSPTTLRLDAEGNVLAGYEGYSRESPDGRFLLRVDGMGRERAATVLELATGREASIRSPAVPSWTPDGYLMVLQADE